MNGVMALSIHASSVRRRHSEHLLSWHAGFSRAMKNCLLPLRLADFAAQLVNKPLIPC